jgi:hypothetical protein
MGEPGIAPPGEQRRREDPVAGAPYLLDRRFSAMAILEVGWRVEPLGEDRCRRGIGCFPGGPNGVCFAPTRRAGAHELESLGESEL